MFYKRIGTMTRKRQPNHTIQRMRASRLVQGQFKRFGRLALTADGER
jgi:hypothetical protein